MKSDKYLSNLRKLNSSVEKRAPKGERVLASLFPSRGTGWPGGWSQDRLQQVLHLRNWVMCAVDLVSCKTASIFPNLAYSVDQEKPGLTVKACERGCLNAVGRGFGGTPYIGTHRISTYVGTDGWSAGGPVSSSGHAFLTMGEYRSKALSVVKPHENLEPLEAQHPLRRLFENPNSVDTWFDFAYEWQMFEELCGVAYVWVVPNDYGMPAELWVLPSHWVWPRTGNARPPDGGISDYLRSGARWGPMRQDEPQNSYYDPFSEFSDHLIQYYEVRPWGGFGSAGVLRIPPNEIIMTRWKSPINKIDGYSKQAAGAQWIDLDESIARSRWAQQMNVARPELAIELGAGYDDPDDERIERVEAKIAAKFQGEYNYGKPLILSPGSKATPLSFSPSEMAYFQSAEQTRDWVLALWRIPKTALGMAAEMTYGSILATLAALCTYCLNPRLFMRGQVLTKFLGARYNQRGRTVKCWYDDCVPADPAQVNEDIAQDLAGYAILPNEIRAIRGRKVYRFGGNDPIVNGEIMPLNTGRPEFRESEIGPVPPPESSAGGGALPAERVAPAEGTAPAIGEETRGLRRRVRKQLQLLEVPNIRQEDDYSCVAMCAMSAARFLGVRGPETKEGWKKALGTSKRTSTLPKNVVKYLKELGLGAELRTDLELEDLEAAWKREEPVICFVQEYGVPSKQTSYKYGHSVVYIGSAMGYVFLQDPSMDNALHRPGGSQSSSKDPDSLQAPGRSIVREEDFLQAWHDEDYLGRKGWHMGIVVSRAVPAIMRKFGKPPYRCVCYDGQHRLRRQLRGTDLEELKREAQETVHGDWWCQINGADGKEVWNSRKLQKGRGQLCRRGENARYGCIPVDRSLPSNVRALVAKLDAPIRKAVEIGAGIHRKLEGVYQAGQQFAEAVARKRGLSSGQTARVGRVLARVDAVGRWAVPTLAWLHGTLGDLSPAVEAVAVKGLYYAPAATLAFIAWMLLTSKSPWRLVLDAREAMKHGSRRVRS